MTLPFLNGCNLMDLTTVLSGSKISIVLGFCVKMCVKMWKSKRCDENRIFTNIEQAVTRFFLLGPKLLLFCWKCILSIFAYADILHSAKSGALCAHLCGNFKTLSWLTWENLLQYVDFSVCKLVSFRWRLSLIVLYIYIYIRNQLKFVKSFLSSILFH